ncbi:hypothetical protein HBH98_245950 [Parastagonospora nodorum]|nr:hypothetical protein HBH53_249610 [Parastagonospora nodorum]KAH3956372.1 hypothetical protein HBH51_243390 [Parastagonospora nodorum]KAH4215556.1 hypothetical protein HBI06_247440 [Parastagonospora nodorum]KAH4223679.1 hypothetical protein HBI05_243510 [Parastagonospora nodorum]KAH4333595.1 hypothetical protein HBH98_245950 [Parastagonospora nodorum]
MTKDPTSNRADRDGTALHLGPASDGKTEDGVQEDGVVREMSVFLAVLVSRRPLAQHVTSDAIGGLLALDAS